MAISMLFSGESWSGSELPGDVARWGRLRVEVPASEAPRGRVLAVDALAGSRQAQVMYLPVEARVCPWDPSEPMRGAATMLRARMADFEFS